MLSILPCEIDKRLCNVYNINEIVEKCFNKAVEAIERALAELKITFEATLLSQFMREFQMQKRERSATSSISQGEVIYKRCVQFVVTAQQAISSCLQRRFRIGAEGMTRLIEDRGVFALSDGANGVHRVPL